MSNLVSPYLSFNRQEWSELRNSVPMSLTAEKVQTLQGINEHLTMAEAADIYLPLTRLLHLHIEAQQQKNLVLERFLGHTTLHTPFIIGIAGSVAVGKSTTARLLKELLSSDSSKVSVELVNTDGFLYSNAVLKQRDIMHKKGFPESYDIKSLVQFISDMKAGKDSIQIPVYSHLTYDITDEVKRVEQPDILIIEGLNVLQSGMDYPHDPHRVFISDFLDYSIFVDAEPEHIEEWYVQRFLKFRKGAFTHEGSYFNHYTKLTLDEAIATARSIWKNINGSNLKSNILPTRGRANLILKKDSQHSIHQVLIRK
ncbi:type I pantothenate kinase [Aliivibrio kagoshimensis]|uniref:type I pantothenate kinase n=1 Tax=Aliivibrio kagoshimensis TaxID=2910230 RepID=UPI003D0E033E